MTHRTTTPNSMTKPVMGILAAERHKGYREGLSQITSMAQDEWHEEGRIEGLRQAEAERKRWGHFCFLFGIAVSALT
jgi:hypothetical protein